MSRLPAWLTALCASTATFAAADAAAELCAAWSEPRAAGALDVSQLPEASGIAVASDGRRLYVLNDGTRPAFYVSALDGSGATRVAVGGFAPRDMEDIAVGPCGTGRCVFIADIGDNSARRDTIQIAVIDELAGFGATVDARRVVVARYPGGPRDAEAFAVDPAGNFWILSKARFGRSTPAVVYRLPAAAVSAGREVEFEQVGEIPTASLSAIGAATRRVATAMDFSPDGRRLAVLTYDVAYEIAVDSAESLTAPPLPAAGAWQAGVTHREIPIAPLIQAESIAYADGGRTLLYTTESIAGSAAPIFSQTCR